MIRYPLTVIKEVSCYFCVIHDCTDTRGQDCPENKVCDVYVFDNICSLCLNTQIMPIPFYEIIGKNLGP